MVVANLHDEGCLHLMCAFWELVRYDLATGNHKTHEWLKTPEFVWWASTTLPIDPDQARCALSAHWNACLHDPSAANTYASYRRWMRSGGGHPHYRREAG